MADPLTAAATAPWWGPPAVAAAGSLLGGIATSAFNVFQADKNRDFQRDMSGSAHQREMEDLRRAGLNPILSGKHAGASTPPGAVASGADFGQGVNSAMQMASMIGQLKLQEAQAADLNSAASLKSAQTSDIWYMQEQRLQNLKAEYQNMLNTGRLQGVQARQAEAEIIRIQEQIANLRLEGKHSALGIAEAERMSEFFRSPGGKLAPSMRHLGKLPGSLFEAFRMKNP